MNVSKEKYESYHTANLVPTKWKINVKQFKEEVNAFPFYKWGDTHTEYPRYACPLVNQLGIFVGHDKSIGPLDRLNFLLEFPRYRNKKWTDDHVRDWKEWTGRDHNMDDLINESHFTIPTIALSMRSLGVIDDLKPYLYRSSILKWDYLGHFKEHIDTWHPTQWFRLWGTTDPDGMVLRYNGKEQMDVEAGRLYLHDSITKHEGLAYRDNVYQFFLAFEPNETLLHSAFLKN
jgi:hypothetical protein